MPPCNQCVNPTLCTSRCQAYAEELAACAKSGQMDSSQVAAHVEAGEMPPLPTHPQQEKPLC